MYNDQFTKLETFFKEVFTRLDIIDRKLQELVEDDYYEDEKPAPISRATTRNEIDISDRFIEEEEIYKLGQKIPYTRITDPVDLDAFREFIAYILMHEDRFTSQEVDYAGFSNKNFSDIRLADKTRRILSQAYFKLHKKQWDFKLERGIMHKWQGQIAWSWADGSRD